MIWIQHRTPPEIAALDLPIRARRGLELLAISSVDELCLVTEGCLLNVPNFGLTTLRSVVEALSSHGRYLAPIGDGLPPNGRPVSPTTRLEMLETDVSSLIARVAKLEDAP